MGAGLAPESASQECKWSASKVCDSYRAASILPTADIVRIVTDHCGNAVSVTILSRRHWRFRCVNA
jgi:hypothetical protein